MGAEAIESTTRVSFSASSSLPFACPALLQRKQSAGLQTKESAADRLVFEKSPAPPISPLTTARMAAYTVVAVSLLATVAYP